MARNQTGTSLIEVLVTMALVSIAVMAAGSLIVHSTQLQKSVILALGDPVAEQVVAWLRRDVHMAAGLQHASFSWTDHELALKNQDGTSVFYSIDGDTLIRADVDSKGAVTARRTLLRPIAEWRWRSPTANLVEIEVTLPFHGNPLVDTVETQRIRTVLALRGGYGGRSW